VPQINPVLVQILIIPLRSSFDFLCMHQVAGTFYAKCDMASRMCIKRALFFSFLLTLLVLVRTDGPCSLLVFVVKAILRLV
jgi:hypothetical protein